MGGLSFFLNIYQNSAINLARRLIREMKSMDELKSKMIAKQNRLIRAYQDDENDRTKNIDPDEIVRTAVNMVDRLIKLNDAESAKSNTPPPWQKPE